MEIVANGVPGYLFSHLVMAGMSPSLGRGEAVAGVKDRENSCFPHSPENVGRVGQGAGLSIECHRFDDRPSQNDRLAKGRSSRLDSICRRRSVCQLNALPAAVGQRGSEHAWALARWRGASGL